MAQPKRLALFAYLMLSDADTGQSRDAIMGVFWPESPEQNARTSLRQALRYLRRALGPEVIMTRGRSWVGVDCERVSCDLWQLEAHLERGERTEALGLFRGELLHGLELRGAPEFDDWLDVRRRALARRMAGVAGELAEEARDEGDAASALAFARRALEIGPAIEEEVRRLMGIQLWMGDRAGALNTYEQLERRLADQFDAAPSIRTRELAERARGAQPVPATTVRGETPEGAVPPVGEDPVGAPVEEATGEPTGQEPGQQPGQEPDPETVPVSSPVPARRRTHRITTGLLLSFLALAILVYTAVADGGAGLGPARGADRSVEVVIFPFEVRAADPSLRLLREGMVELLAPFFTGAVGPRAVRSVPAGGEVDSEGSGLRNLEAAARARGVGAEWFLTGRVLGDGRQVHLQAVMGTTAGDLEIVRTSVSGSADSVYGLARELGGRLLAVSGGASEAEAELLGRHSPEALRTYLLGREAYRAGLYEDADRHYRAALRHDSLFAQAALGLVETHLSAPWLHGHTFETALPLAFRLRDRLSPADREVVTAVAGPWHPGPSSQREHYRAWEQAVQQAPDRPEVWFQWGDALYHVGPFIGIADARRRAEDAFLRTLELDSAYLLPLGHLTEMAVEAGELERAESYLRRLLGSVAEPANADYLRWRVALAAGDAAELESLRSRFESMNTVSLGAILAAAQFTGEGLQDAERIARLPEYPWDGPAQRTRMLQALQFYELNRGRQEQAGRDVDRLATAGTDRATLYMDIRYALFAGGAVSRGEQAAERLSALVEAELGDAETADVCAMETWKLHQGNRSTIERSLATLNRRAARAEETLDRTPGWCATYLEALQVDRNDPAAVKRAGAWLRDLVSQGIGLPGVHAEAPRLTAIALLEASGAPGAALSLTRLRASVPYPLATQLRLEGRLAAMTGDTVAAVRAYEHYLKLRTDPAPPLVPQRDSVVAEYRALAAAARGGETRGSPPR